MHGILDGKKREIVDEVENRVSSRSAMVVGVGIEFGQTASTCRRGNQVVGS